MLYRMPKLVQPSRMMDASQSAAGIDSVLHMP